MILHMDKIDSENFEQLTKIFFSDLLRLSM